MTNDELRMSKQAHRLSVIQACPCFIIRHS
jgi:hypothetical protein